MCFCYKDKFVTDIIYEDELVMAFMDMEPINEGHILVVPKVHYLDVDEMPDETLSHLMIISKKNVNAEIVTRIRDKEEYYSTKRMLSSEGETKGCTCI